MQQLPEITPNRIAIKLKPKAEILVKKGHPWIFEDSIVKQNKKNAAAGDIAILFDQRKDKVFGVGLYDPASPIRIKVIHQGPATIDQHFFKAAIATAFKKRERLLQTDTNSYRLLFGENDGFPGCIVDVYAGVLVLKLYSSIWYPYLKEIIPLLVAQSNATTVVLRLSRNLQKQPQHALFDGQVVYGTLKDEVVVFKEHGIRFSANVIKGHKTGYFLDHRENRRKVGKLAAGKSVLDVFSYAGGFSVHALAGGAKEVVSLDISAQALEMASHNVALNMHYGTHRTMVRDAFEGLQELIANGRQFDMVIIDPPSFAKSAKEIPSAKNSYLRLAKLGAQLVANKGILVLASCSSRVSAQAFFDISESGLQSRGRAYQIIDKTAHDSDHPISFPEGAYLKCGYYKFE